MMQSRKRVLLLFICATVTSQANPLAIPTTIVPPANPASPATVFACACDYTEERRWLE
jgi:hypothetical protein